MGRTWSAGRIWGWNQLQIVEGEVKIPQLNALNRPCHQMTYVLKACAVSLGYNDTICDDLSGEGNDQVQDETQVHLNKFEIANQYISSVPAIIYSLFIGALSDKYGRKPLILIPILGSITDDVLAIIHVTYQR